MDPGPADHQACWLTRARLTRLGAAGVITYCLAAAAILLTARGGYDAMGIPLGFDFLAFYGGSAMAAAGDLTAAFDPQAFTASLERLVPGVGYGYLWLYPPGFALMATPLAWLPYGIAFWLWTAAGLFAYAAAVRFIARDGTAILAAIGFPAAWVAAYHGQSAFFIAALYVLACGALVRREDRLAGLAIGLLTIKPHLALLFPIALAAAGRGRAFLAAAISAVVFTSLSIAVVGWTYAEAFVHSMPQLGEMLLGRERHWATIASVFATMRLAGAPESVAWAAHGTIAAAAAALVFARCRQHGLSNETLAIVCAGSLLISPYVMDYDLMILAAAGCLLFARAAGGEAASSREAALALTAAMIPIVAVVFGRHGLQIGWLAPMIVIALAEARLSAKAPVAAPA